MTLSEAVADRALNDSAVVRRLALATAPWGSSAPCGRTTRASRDADAALVEHLRAAREFVLEAYDSLRLTRGREAVYDEAVRGTWSP